MDLYRSAKEVSRKELFECYNKNTLEAKNMAKKNEKILEELIKNVRFEISRLSNIEKIACNLNIIKCYRIAEYRVRCKIRYYSGIRQNDSKRKKIYLEHDIGGFLACESCLKKVLKENKQ